jgi:glycosyltransferase involved in cell wall biosynthesis
MRIVTVLPAYNEAAHIRDVLRQFPTHLGSHEVAVVVVDDGSADDTYAQARLEQAKAKREIHVLRHRTNLGKGAAAKTGCDAALRLGADVICLMDSDGQHKVSDLGRLTAPVLENDILVIGCRERTGQMPAMMRLGNAVLTKLSHLLFGITAVDTQSGYRVFRAASYPRIRWVAQQYAMETEMLILATKNQVPVLELPIETIYLDGVKGTTPLDGLRIVRTLVQWKFRSVREVTDESLGELDQYEFAPETSGALS